MEEFAFVPSKALSVIPPDENDPNPNIYFKIVCLIDTRKLSNLFD
jgi:hypothetical protein